jgi:hypothetical protein
VSRTLVERVLVGRRVIGDLRVSRGINSFGLSEVVIERGISLGVEVGPESDADFLDLSVLMEHHISQHLPHVILYQVTQPRL